MEQSTASHPSAPGDQTPGAATDSPHDDKAATRARIVEAATARFEHYGYAKTTMAEIARDLSMSTGNLYRFFESKLDIAVAIASHKNEEEDAMYFWLASQPAPAEVRLREHLFTVLRHTFTMIADSPKIYEIARVISEQRPSFANGRLAVERKILRGIFRDGVAEGVFAPGTDSEEVAEMFQVTMMKFRYPQLFSKLPLAALERELDGALNLVLRGLRTRRE